MKIAEMLCSVGKYLQIKAQRLVAIDIHVRVMYVKSCGTLSYKRSQPMPLKERVALPWKGATSEIL